MSNLEKNCVNCGASLKRVGLRRYKCEYCEMTYLLTNKELAVESPQKTANKEIVVGQGCAGIMVAFVLLMFVGILGSLVIGGMYQGWKAIFGEESSKIQVVYEEEVSDNFKEFARQIFGKNYEELTRADMANVTELYIRDTEGIQYGYCVVDGENVPFQVECHHGDILKFLYKFSNIAIIDSEVEFYGDYVEQLENLTQLTCENSVAFLAKILPCPEKITYLSDVEIGPDVKVADLFPNLLVLDASVDSANDLSMLDGLTQLKELTLQCFEQVTDASAIGSLSNLEKLDIYTRSIDNLDFLYKLDKLKSLTINNGSEIKSLLPIAGLPELSALNFEYYYGAKDWEVIEGLTGLLELGISYNMPKELDITKFTDLKSLKVLYADEFDGAVLRQLPQLETVYLEDVIKVTNGEQLFGGENLRELTIYDCGIHGDIGLIEENESLERLCIKYCRFEDSELKETLDVFARFPSLKELTIRGMRLEGLDFVLNLQDLQVLDVIGNNVTDVSVLAGCKNLRELWCGANALVGDVELNGVFVFTVQDDDSWYRYKY